MPDELAYLAGRSLSELLAAECRATSGALASAGRMHTVLRLPEVTEDTVGELLMFYQLATGFAGAWYGVNPFDQPGVELGKQLTFAAMGRSGSGTCADAARPIRVTSPRSCFARTIGRLVFHVGH